MYIPESLHRYFTFENGFKLIKSSKLILSSFKGFNDPFEFLPQSKYSKDLISKCTSKIRDLIQHLEKRNKEEVFFWPRQIGPIKHYLGFLENVRLACFSEMHDNILMWGHYGGQHTGIVISFKTSIDIWGGNNFYPVRYSNARQSIFDTDEQADSTTLGKQWQYDLFCSKAECWNYEREWRFIKYKKHIPNFSVGESDIHYVEIEEDAIDAIRLGCQISQKDKEELINYCIKNLPNVKIYQFFPDITNYSLAYEEISF